MRREEKEGLMKKFRQLFEAVLDKGDFEPVTEEFIEHAYSGKDSAGGGFMGTGMEVSRDHVWTAWGAPIYLCRRTVPRVRSSSSTHTAGRTAPGVAPWALAWR